ncbi:hypothetical protein FB561_5192 [Kribbella amoyensis]|uniref:Uncharacterized protein n=2 Tax=Kribbella amoyensis TaxID=996641 RepID=A0A561BYN9_9ACTN|nr:hypothetical protein FB561_5192 [Kribbella amoyensis]
MVMQPGPTSSSRSFTAVLLPFEPLPFELKNLDGLDGDSIQHDRGSPDSSG